jgi:flagellin
MSLTLNTNVSALTTQQYLNINTTNTATALQQLSSGSRLNSPADDPADYAIAYKLGVKSASLATSINNGNQALSMLQVAQGGIEQIGNILTQLKQIATEAASSNTDTSDLPALQTQVNQLETEINNIASGTQYGGTQVLQGANTVAMTGAEVGAGIDSINVSGAAVGTYSLTAAWSTTGVTFTMWQGLSTQTVFLAAGNEPAAGSDATVNFNTFGISMQVNNAVTGLAATQTLAVAAGTSSFTYQVGSEDMGYAKITASIANFNTGGTVLNLPALQTDVTTQANAQNFMATIDLATSNLNTQAGSIGASQNEITYQVANLQSMNTNTQSAESTIKDTNYAAAMSNFTQAQVASQAGVAMLSQANQLPQEILSLIKGG